MIFVFALLCLAAAASGHERDRTHERGVCSGDGTKLTSFARPKGARNPQLKRYIVNTRMACKYHAVHDQICGKYTINLVPGNIFMHPKYRHNTIWLMVKETDHPENWIGMRSSNKKVVKYLRGTKSSFWTRKRGTMQVDDVFTNNGSSHDVATASNDDFKVSFRAWDPDNRPEFPQSEWSFQCLDKNFELDDPETNTQLCGADQNREMRERDIDNRDHYPYFDVFTKPGLAQTNPKCTEAEVLFSSTSSNCSTDAKKKLAISTCSQILYSRDHYICVTKYACDPMDVFLSCVKWVCSDYTWEEECENVGRAIDYCRKFKEGNLTDLVEDANCYKDFLPLIVEEDEG